VFAVNELESFGGEASGSVTSFAVDSASTRLNTINVQPSRGGSPCHLALDRTGRSLAVANYSGGNYALFPVGSHGELHPATSVVSGAVVGSAKPLGHMVGFDSANRFLIAADLGLDRLLVYRFDASARTLRANQPGFVSLPAGWGPRHYAFHPNDRWLFAINETAATVTTFSWDAKAGTLSARGSLPTRPAGVEGGSTAEIAVHPSGRFVYGSNRGHDSIVVFAVGVDGTLTLVEHESTRGQTPRHFALDRSGRWLIAANQKSNTLAVFSIDQASGALSPVGPLTSIASPVSLLFL
jgi:6-phosphogluconolactonase